MKNLYFFKYVAILLLLTRSFSCQNMDTQKEVIEPLVPDDEVIAFFEEHLPTFACATSDCFFVDIDKIDNVCLKINSVDEFRKISSCSSTILPVIDFNCYTLIIGQYYATPSSGYSIVGQNLIIEAKKMELNLIVEIMENGWGLSLLCNLYYWGIYPKINNEHIIVNVKYQ